MEALVAGMGDNSRSEVTHCLVTTSVDGTRACAGAIAGLVAVGDTIILVGDLGAGKTAFAQGFSAALGVASPVTSPTFTLANRYAGKGGLVVNHLDVYRFDHLSEAHDLALPELAEDGVTLVEWGDRIMLLLPEEHLQVTIKFPSSVECGDDDCRLLELAGRGEAWRLRSDRLRFVLEPWIREGACC